MDSYVIRGHKQEYRGNNYHINTLKTSDGILYELFVNTVYVESSYSYNSCENTAIGIINLICTSLEEYRQSREENSDNVPF